MQQYGGDPCEASYEGGLSGFLLLGVVDDTTLVSEFFFFFFGLCCR